MKLTAAIAASYFGAMVRTPDGDYRMHHVAPNLMCIEVETGNQFDYVAYDQCQLILTPLDKISDEDAVEVVKIWYKGSEKISTISIDEGKRIALSMCVPSEITDYLRSKSYNIGYGKYTAQDLITEGVVIVNNKNKGI